MELIKRVEIGYFRSIYKATIDDLGGTTILFGRNDAGKSNVLRALNLFFNGETNPGQAFDLDRDLNHARAAEASESAGRRKFVYVKITFQTPSSYRPSLGSTFWVRKQWSLNAQAEPSITDSIQASSHQTYLKRLISKISFHYIPAIKDRRIFESLLGATYQVLASQPKFRESLMPFSEAVRESTQRLSNDLLDSLRIPSFIAPPTDLSDLFRSLDFETQNDHGDAYSLKLQRGDGVQVRHIPAILSFLADSREHEFHVWGFEEPENSLELATAIEEAESFVGYGAAANKQVFLTSHSPAFFNARGAGVRRYYVSREPSATVATRLVSELSHVADDDPANDPSDLMGETPHLAVISSYLRHADEAIKSQKAAASELEQQIAHASRPIVFVEGPSDVTVLRAAWNLMIATTAPFTIEACEGTTKMSALAANGRVLAAVGSNRALFVVADNDGEGRRLFNNGHLKRGGKWVKHSNGAQWCLLPPSEDFKQAMARLKVAEADWPFTLENVFTPSVRKEGIRAGVYRGTRAPYEDLHANNHAMLEKVLGLPATDDDRLYLFPIDHEYKEPFANWIAERAPADPTLLEPFRVIVEGLRDLLPASPGS